MSSTIKSINFDSHDALAVARFWAEALGWSVASWSSEVAAAVESAGADFFLYFERVPEGKQVKNRVHLDLEPDGSASETVARLLDSGASKVQQLPGFTVLADPEGNEFCVVGATA